MRLTALHPLPLARRLTIERRRRLRLRRSTSTSASSTLSTSADAGELGFSRGLGSRRAARRCRPAPDDRRLPPCGGASASGRRRRGRRPQAPARRSASTRVARPSSAPASATATRRAAAAASASARLRATFPCPRSKSGTSTETPPTTDVLVVAPSLGDAEVHDRQRPALAPRHLDRGRRGLLLALGERERGTRLLHHVRIGVGVDRGAERTERAERVRMPAREAEQLAELAGVIEHLGARVRRFALHQLRLGRDAKSVVFARASPARTRPATMSRRCSASRCAFSSTCSRALGREQRHEELPGRERELGIASPDLHPRRPRPASRRRRPRAARTPVIGSGAAIVAS